MKNKETIPLPSAAPGTARALKVIRYKGSDQGRKVYIQAGLHSDEAPGYLVAHQLEKLFDKARILGEIVLVPAANPIGLSQWRDEMLQGRFHFPTSVNFNRQHLDLISKVAESIKGKLGAEPTDNIALIRKTFGKILAAIETEDESSFLKKQLLTFAHDADIVLDLHCDHEALLHLYMGTPLWPDGADLAAELKAEVILLAKNSGDNPFDEACSRIWWELAAKFPGSPIPPACLSVTVELRGIADTAPGTAEEDAQNIFRFLLRRGIIEGTPPPLPTLINEATPLTGVDYVKAQVPGVVVYHKKPGDWVKKNEVIADILNPLPLEGEKQIHPVKSRTEGRLFTRNYDRFARPGRIIAKIAGKIPLRQNSGNLLTQ